MVEGRDIGTVVAPDADLKVFLTASARPSGPAGAAPSSAADLRGHRGRPGPPRPARLDPRPDPLAQAADAVVLDSTELGIDEVVARLRAAAT